MSSVKKRTKKYFNKVGRAVNQKVGCISEHFIANKFKVFKSFDDYFYGEMFLVINI